MNEYVIINKTAIQNRIEELEVLKRIHCYGGTQQNEDEFQRCNNEQSTLKKILSQSTPLIPEIEKAFDAGDYYCYWGNTENKSISSTVLDKENYISKLKLDI